MIAARSSAGRIIAQLSDRARKLAAAHAVMRRRARRRDGQQWRDARLLWPLQAGED